MRGALPILAGALFLTFAAACSQLANEETGEAESAWGHLSSARLNATAPQFLINKDVGAKYRVCLASYMTQALPGIETEIDAAINVWGQYLGRTIPVEVVTKELPRAAATAVRGRGELRRGELHEPHRRRQHHVGA